MAIVGYVHAPHKLQRTVLHDAISPYPTHVIDCYSLHFYPALPCLVPPSRRQLLDEQQVRLAEEAEERLRLGHEQAVCILPDAAVQPGDSRHVQSPVLFGPHLGTAIGHMVFAPLHSSLSQ